MRQNTDGVATLDGRIPDLMAFMNIEESQADCAFGILAPVSESDLRALDAREKLYVRLDITDQMEILNGTVLPESARVFTYVSFSWETLRGDEQVAVEGHRDGMGDLVDRPVLRDTVDSDPRSGALRTFPADFPDRSTARLDP